MNSASSIFAAVCKFDSLLQVLSADPNIIVSKSRLLAIISDHFGLCPVFKLNFATLIAPLHKSLSFSTSSANNIIEQALHGSVRHLCSKECFLRSYLPIREFSMFWRDIAIHESMGTTKEQLLLGWRCLLVPLMSQLTTRRQANNSLENIEHDDTNYTVETVGRKRKRNESVARIVYLSPSGTEYRTKASVVKAMNQNHRNNLDATTSKHASSLVNFDTMSKNIEASPTKCTRQSSALINHTTKLNPLYSPLGLLEELFVDDPWRLLVSTICLNVTTRGQVDSVLHDFLQRWPTAEATSTANWEDISVIISPLGLGSKRAKGLVRFSAEYIELTKDFDAFSLTEKQITGLFFCGQYSWSAYNIFIRKELPSRDVRVCDHALQLYVEFQLGRRGVNR